jgi:hypothetical protein
MLKEYGVGREGLTIDEWWLMRAIASERNRWEREKQEERTAFSRAGLKGKFEDYMRNKKGVREYL